MPVAEKNSPHSNQIGPDISPEKPKPGLISEDQLGVFQIARSLRSMRSLAPRPEFKRFSPNSLVKNLPEQPVTFLAVLRLNVKEAFSTFQRSSIMTQVFLSIILLFSLGLGSYAAVDAANPGDFLYQLDTGIEDIQLAFRSKPEGLLTSRLSNALERLQEGEKELAEGHYEQALQAFQAYEREMIQVRAVVANAEIGTQERLQSRLRTALMLHTQIKIRIMENVSTQTRTKLQNALKNTFQPQESPQGPNEESPQGPNDEAPQGPNEEAPHGPNEEAPHGPNEEAPHGPNEEAPHGPNEEAPQGPNEEAPQGPAEYGK